MFIEVMEFLLENILIVSLLLFQAANGKDAAVHNGRTAVPALNQFVARFSYSAILLTDRAIEGGRHLFCAVLRLYDIDAVCIQRASVGLLEKVVLLQQFNQIFKKGDVHHKSRGTK